MPGTEKRSMSVCWIKKSLLMFIYFITLTMKYYSCFYVSKYWSGTYCIMDDFEFKRDNLAMYETYNSN